MEVEKEKVIQEEEEVKDKVEKEMDGYNTGKKVKF